MRGEYRDGPEEAEESALREGLLQEAVGAEELRALLDRLEATGDGVTVGAVSEATGRSPEEVGAALLEIRRARASAGDEALRELARELAAWRTSGEWGAMGPIWTQEELEKADRAANRAIIWALVIVVACCGLIWWLATLA